mmetsp:Transcript_26638/g.26526  ORF Transcript_26638/g.26526 Transcript_26638/m.26526 type:complete len:109 (+) Transcript_26638:298-624(+)
MTTNTFYNGLTKNSNHKPVEISPATEEIDPELYEVAAKKESALWKTYKDNDYREDVNATSNRANHDYDTEVATKLHSNKHNKRVTVISEYSNAMHNGRVFKNPRFTSC